MRYWFAHYFPTMVVDWEKEKIDTRGDQRLRGEGNDRRGESNTEVVSKMTPRKEYSRVVSLNQY